MAGLLLALLPGGCARERMHVAPAPDLAVNLEQRKAMCINLLRDARLWCRKRPQDDIQPARYDCLAARIKLDRYCY